MTLKTIILAITFFVINCAFFPNSSHLKNSENGRFSIIYRDVNPVGNIHIVVDKSDYELHVFDERGWFVTYPVVFGNNSLADKKMEGDRNTPEGEFKISAKYSHAKWRKFISIDYPNEESWKKFKERKNRGEIPSSARIGGGIGIHGTWPNEDYQIDRYNNWTLGCISLKNIDIDHLYSYLEVGTRVIIRK